VEGESSTAFCVENDRSRIHTARLIGYESSPSNPPRCIEAWPSSPSAGVRFRRAGQRYSFELVSSRHVFTFAFLKLIVAGEGTVDHGSIGLEKIERGEILAQNAVSRPRRP